MLGRIICFHLNLIIIIALQSEPDAKLGISWNDTLAVEKQRLRGRYKQKLQSFKFKAVTSVSLNAMFHLFTIVLCLPLLLSQVLKLNTYGHRGCCDTREKLTARPVRQWIGICATSPLKGVLWLNLTFKIAVQCWLDLTSMFHTHKHLNSPHLRLFQHTVTPPSASPITSRS